MNDIQQKQKPAYTKFQKLLTIWFSLFTFICLVNTIVLFFRGPDYSGVVIFVPFAHLMAVVVVYMVYSLYWWFHIAKNPDLQYIKNKYPDIWKRLHPWGDYSINGFASILFHAGKYDDGSDENLNRIKAYGRIQQRLIAWPFLLMIVVAFITVIIMLVLCE